MKQLIAIAFILTVAACGSVDTSYVLTGQAQSPQGGEIHVVMEGQPAAPGYVELGLVQARATGRLADMPNVVTGLVSQARALGADAIINVRIDQGATMASGTAVAVRYAQ